MYIEFLAKDAPRDSRFAHHSIQEYYQGAKTVTIPGGFRIKSDYYDDLSVMIPSELGKYLYMNFSRNKKGAAHLKDIQALMEDCVGQDSHPILLDVTERQEKKLRLQNGIPDYCSIAPCVVKNVKTTQAFFAWAPLKTTLAHHADGSVNVHLYDTDGINIGVVFVVP